MRYLVFVGILGSAAAAEADGVYVEESFGQAAYRGDLAAYSEGGNELRVQIGLGYRRGPWTVELVGGGIASDMFCIPCGEARMQLPRYGSYIFYGADLRHGWPMPRTQLPGIATRFVMHAGPRYLLGDHALAGYHGPGVHAGAGFECSASILGFFVEAGVDAMWLAGPADRVTGVVPHVAFGAKLGWP